MGRASRRKRARASAKPAPPVGPGRATATTAPGGSRSRRGLLAIAGAAVVVGVVLAALWLPTRGPRQRASSAPDAGGAIPGETTATTRAADSGPGRSLATAPPLPDPDTSAMTPPVARALRTARAEALSRPASAAAVGRYGELLQAHWLNAEAAASYELARRLAPREFRWVYLLAAVEELRAAEGERVVSLFREAIELSPVHAPAYVRLADALLRLGRWAEARKLYGKAVELDPDLVLAHRGRGQAATLLGDGAAAIDSLERAAELAPEDRITQVALARAYSVAGRDERAAEAAAAAQTRSSEARLPDQIFFEVQNLALDPESLRGRIRRALRRGDESDLLAALALLEESEGTGVRRQFAAAAKRNANRLGFAGDYDAALREFERAARLTPDDPEIEHNWGTVLLRRGDLEPATHHFERAFELNPTSADSLYNLGVALEGLGRADEAIESFRAAAAIDPGHVAAERLRQLDSNQ